MLSFLSFHMPKQNHSFNRENTWVSPNDGYNGDVDIERLDIVTDAKIDAAVAKARKAYFQKLV